MFFIVKMFSYNNNKKEKKKTFRNIFFNKDK